MKLRSNFPKKKTEEAEKKMKSKAPLLKDIRYKIRPSRIRYIFIRVEGDFGRPSTDAVRPPDVITSSRIRSA